MHHAKTYWLKTTILIYYLLSWILGVRDSGEARQSSWGLLCNCGGCWSRLGPSQRLLHSPIWCWAGAARAPWASPCVSVQSLQTARHSEFRGAGPYVCWLRAPKGHVPRESPRWTPPLFYFPTIGYLEASHVGCLRLRGRNIDPTSRRNMSAVHGKKSIWDLRDHLWKYFLT